uniref:Uncharacterized protein n=1 Tax=Arundo donax TaxID=35708 RepID=A0A0A9BB26_ARUDO
MVWGVRRGLRGRWVGVTWRPPPRRRFLRGGGAGV